MLPYLTVVRVGGGWRRRFMCDVGCSRELQAGAAQHFHLYLLAISWPDDACVHCTALAVGCKCVEHVLWRGPSAAAADVDGQANVTQRTTYSTLQSQVPDNTVAAL